MSAKPSLPCIVTRGGRPQALRCLLSNRRRSALLVTPKPGEPAAIFANRRCALRAIHRTHSAAAAVAQTMLAGLPVFVEMRRAEPFTVLEASS